jgi:hypothetical protein
MDPITIASGAQIIGGLLGGIFGGSGKADEKYNQAVMALESVGMPPNQARQVALEQFKSIGNLTPEMEQEIALAQSKVAGIQEDPRMKDAQMEALQTLQQYAKTGLTPQDRARYNQIRTNLARENEAKRQQFIQNTQARGGYSGGTEAAMVMAAQQQASQQASEEADRMSAAAAMAALEGANRSGTLSGAIRGQDFDVNRIRAQAADENANVVFNAANSRQQRNVGAKNQAQEYNLRQAQDIANRNIEQSNAERYRQLNAERQYWQDKLSRGKTMAELYAGESKRLGEQAQNTADRFKGIGAGVGGAIKDIAAYNADPEGYFKSKKDKLLPSYYNAKNTEDT